MRNAKALLGALSGALILAGCATTKQVDTKVSESQAQTDKKMEALETQIETLQEQQRATAGKVSEHDQQLEKLGQSASDALRRANEAGVLAKGKVVFQESFQEDRVRFRPDSYGLDDHSKSALDEFAQKVKALETVVYLEIQGHTDSRGTPTRNEVLGQQRADAVRFYLSKQHKFPLGRMSTISYGDTLPVESNKSAKSRALNRRVVIVVLE